MTIFVLNVQFRINLLVLLKVIIIPQVSESEIALLVLVHINRKPINIFIFLADHLEKKNVGFIGFYFIFKYLIYKGLINIKFDIFFKT